MKIFLLPLIAIAILIPSQVQAQWYSEDGVVPDSEWRKSVGSFGSMMLLSSEPESFLEQWDQPASPGYTPSLSTTSDVKRGDMIVAFVFFSGGQANNKGHCDIIADLAVIGPDGSEYASEPDNDLCSGVAPPPEQRMQLGRAYLGLIIEPQDLLGEYTFTANVCDRVADVCLELKRSFEAKHRLESFDLGELMDSYYLDPRPEFIDEAIYALSESDILENSETFPPAVGFLTEVFSSNPTRIGAWKETISKQPDGPRGVLTNALKLSADTSAIKTALPVSPSQNDMFWGAYFASGDIAYLDLLISNLAFCDERKDLNLFLTGGSAKWSLSSNIRQHFRVKEHVQTRLVDLNGTKNQPLNEAIESAPGDLKEEMVEILRTQHAAGIW